MPGKLPRSRRADKFPAWYLRGMAAGKDPKERFSDRADDYARYRPGYPAEVAGLLADACGLGPSSDVADIGSGTGILSRLLLAPGARVAAVEPNAAMRAVAERALEAEPRFTSVDGSAEATEARRRQHGPRHGAAQAFHWFDVARSRLELARILRPPRWAALVWNLRVPSPFNDAYDAMLEDLAPEYPAGRARDRIAASSVDAFFAPGDVHVARLSNAQRLDADGLRGRLQSSSYAPKPGSPEYPAMAERLARVFAEHAKDGVVAMTYETVVYWGRLPS